MTSLVLLILAPVFPFESPLLSSPPTTTLTDGTQEAFDDGLPCRTAFFGGLFRHNTVVPALKTLGLSQLPAIKTTFFTEP